MKIIILRHGEYEHSGKLSAKGRFQMFRLGTEIKRVIDDERITILSSETRRAQESAAILAEKLNTSVSLNSLLSNNTRTDFASCELLMETLRERDEDEQSVILVTHQPMVFAFTNWHSVAQGKRPDLLNCQPEQGQAMVIDTNSDTYQII